MANQPEIKATNRKYVSETFSNVDPYYSTIQNAIASIPVGSGGYPTSPWAVFVYPGVYNGQVNLKTNISIIGSGIQSTTIKGDGTNPAILGPSDSGNGQCYVNNLTVDGNAQSGFNYPAVSSLKVNFICDVFLFTSVAPGPPQGGSGAMIPVTTVPGIAIGALQSLNIFNLHCINQSTKFDEGIRLTGTGTLELNNSQIAYQSSYCINHQSSGSSEAWNSFLVGGACVTATNGFVNLYVCETVGRIEAHNSARIRHVDSYQAGRFIVTESGAIWVSGMSWAEEPGNDIQFELDGPSSKIIVVNSRAKVVQNGLNVVTINSQTALFKAMNSVIVNTGTGATITGVSSSTPTVFLYYCSMNKDVVTVNRSPDSNYLVSANVE